MRVEVFEKYEFFAGVPDSQLKPLCDWLMSTRGISKNHIVAANEGNAVAIATGYYLATGKIPVVYLQNSGIGNIVNPVASLTHPKIYGIPMLFVVGWRGEPGVYDEPQHICQGEITAQLLDTIGIKSYVIDSDTHESHFRMMESEFEKQFAEGKSAAFIVRKNALQHDVQVNYCNHHNLLREHVIERVIHASGDDIIIATTGKISRELFELREVFRQGHRHDFLTVGSMGHSSSIALGIAMHYPKRRVWIIDGDGAAIMHLGAMATIGATPQQNIIHIIINNASHESVGGIPTVADKINLCKIAEGCGYPVIKCADNLASLDCALNDVLNEHRLCFIEIKTSIKSRNKLGRPTISPADNKKQFMDYLCL